MYNALLCFSLGIDSLPDPTYHLNDIIRIRLTGESQYDTCYFNSHQIT